MERDSDMKNIERQPIKQLLHSCFLMHLSHAFSTLLNHKPQIHDTPLKDFDDIWIFLDLQFEIQNLVIPLQHVFVFFYTFVSSIIY